MISILQPHEQTMFGSGSTGSFMGGTQGATAPLQSLKRRRRGSLEQEEQGGKQSEADTEEGTSVKVLFLSSVSRVLRLD